MSPANLDRLRGIKTLPQLVAYLRDVLDWPIESGDTDEITFDYTAAELGLDEKAAVRIKEIKQLRPLASGQPWGIFFINFEKKQLPVVAMRRILRALALRKRESANKSERQAWQSADLLFISAYGEDSDRALTFAHFVESPDLNLAELRVLGWDDDDTPLKLDYVVRTLGEKLRWQDDFAADPNKWRVQWSEAFRIRHGHVIRTSAELALALAVLARRIRSRVSKILEMEAGTGEIRTLQRAFRIGLIHDLDDAAFADMFAQTITYGLFSLACRRTHPGEGTAFVKDDLTHYFTSPFLKEMLGIFLGIKSRKGKIDFDELGISDVTDLLTSKDTHMEAVLIEFGNKTRGEDPVVHFYEDFLSAYNKQLKVQRGVFYTPQPVVSYIVRSIHELLQTEFGLADGLADTTTWGEMVKKHPDLKLPSVNEPNEAEKTISPNEPFVQILDPATGTATFLVEVIEVVHSHLEAKWKQQRLTEAQQRSAWNAYVPQHLLPRLHAFELMMAPYAIAHMKVGLKLAETGYQFAADERARIYLTNALEPKVSQLPQLGFSALAREAEEVNEIKWYKRFTVVIGNPPYAGASVNMSDHAQSLVDRYRYIAGKRVDEVKLWLQNDYIKFTAFAHSTIESTGVGVLGFITDNSYLDGPTFRGVRYGLAETFRNLRVLDLHGSSKRRDKTESGSADENVFDITQGVSVVIGISKPGQKECLPSYSDLTGSRNEKYALLLKGQFTFTPVHWKPPFYLLVASDHSLREEYDTGIRITDAFVAKGNGFMTGRDGFVIGFTRSEIEARIKDFFDLRISDAEVRNLYGISDYRAFKITEVRRSLKFQPTRIVEASYRPLDHRWTYFQRPIIQEWQSSAHAHMFGRQNRALCVGRAGNVVGGTWDICFCTKMVTDLNQFYRGGNVSLPIYRFPEEGELLDGPVPNFTRDFVVSLGRVLGLALGKSELPNGLTPEDIFHYAYAVFHSPGYRSRYAEFLKIDFPRLPLTESLELFRALARLGGELTGLHLLESPKLDHAITEWVGGRNPEVEKISWTKNTVWVDKAQTTGFKGVRESVWNFHIGGYQVCEKWLKDRKGRTLTKDDIAHYHKIVVALSETIRLMAEIDKVIEKHGGWPGAFATASSVASWPAATPSKAPTTDLGLHTEDELPLA
jgi:hypothetical protein